jgi:3-dehydroquinate synthase
MIDSSIGGKTGVDTPAGKNLVGAFHQPRLVVADVSTLTSLPRNQIAAGLAEAIKHGAIADRPYFDRLVAAKRALFNREGPALTQTVVESVRIKALVVLEDERDHGRRAILNFGHTVGHALESHTGYRLLHGEAIAIGMAVEAALGVRLGITNEADALALKKAVEEFELPYALPEDVAIPNLLDAMRLDKKVRSGAIRLSLIKALGQAAGRESDWTTEISPEVIERVLRESR